MKPDNHMQRAIPPLTGKTKEGILYVRPDRVETEIAAALELPLDRAFELAANGHLTPQTLAFFLRRFRPNGRSPSYDAMLLAFLSRIERAGRRRLLDIPEHWHERAHEFVQDKVFEWFGTERMDIFEMSFARAVECLYLDARAYLKLRIETELSTEDFALSEEIDGEDVVDAMAGRLNRGTLTPAEARSELAGVMAKLTLEEGRALIYVDGLGLIEKEAAQEMKCSVRKVGYRLKSAREKLRDIKDPKP